LKYWRYSEMKAHKWQSSGEQRMKFSGKNR
jgi:hypothetical protein